MFRLRWTFLNCFLDTLWLLIFFWIRQNSYLQFFWMFIVLNPLRTLGEGPSLKISLNSKFLRCLNLELNEVQTNDKKADFCKTLFRNKLKILPVLFWVFDNQKSLRSQWIGWPYRFLRDSTYLNEIKYTWFTLQDTNMTNLEKQIPLWWKCKLIYPSIEVCLYLLHKDNP